jgi:hypothetical protein
VTWWELYLLLYPADKRILEHFKPCCAGCLHCTDYEERLRKWVPEDADSEPPDWKPSLHTCKAAGEDGLLAELLCFTRTAGSAWAFRRHHCTNLAHILTSWLQKGVPRSESFREVLVSAPSKPLKPGAPAPADPAANTRPISVEVLMAKVFELLINARTEHWRFNERLIGAPQVAFSQLLAPDHHVLVLRELIQMRRAQGRGTNVLFVDFKAAYDSVHHDLLWHVLRVMGFPEALITVLSDWLGSRMGRLKVDGELSPPFPMTMGVPQGGPLSTTLWNLFIEPLSRRLAAELPGVRARASLRADGTPLCDDFHVTHLFFADDLAVPTKPTHEAAQRALRITAEWGRDFGVAINDGVGKTEAMHFAATAAESTAVLPTLPPLEVAVPGTRPLSVRWVAEYRYLGAGLRLDLDVNAALERRIATLDHIIARVFTYNSVMSQLSCRAQLQMLNTLALGAVNYLLSVLPASRDIARKVDARIVRVGRRILGVPRFCPPVLLALELPGMPFYATWVMHQVRLLETLTRLPLPDNLAAKLVAFQTHGRPRGHALDGTRYTPFVKRVNADMDKLCAPRGRSSGERALRGVPRPAPTSRHDIHHSVALFRRAYGLLAVLERLPGTANVSARLRRLIIIISSFQANRSVNHLEGADELATHGSGGWGRRLLGCVFGEHGRRGARGAGRTQPANSGAGRGGRTPPSPALHPGSSAHGPASAPSQRRQGRKGGPARVKWAAAPAGGTGGDHQARRAVAVRGHESLRARRQPPTKASARVRRRGKSVGPDVWGEGEVAQRSAHCYGSAARRAHASALIHCAAQMTMWSAMRRRWRRSNAAASNTAPSHADRGVAGTVPCAARAGHGSTVSR